MYKILIIALFSIIIPLSSFADSKDVFQKGNDYYNNGEYQLAINAFDSLLNNNTESADIYYNLGNSWFKLDNIPKAILYFEKAKKLDPENSDIIYNLELANTRIADKIESIPQFFLKTAWINIRNTFNESQWTKINIALFLFFLGFVVLYFVIKSKRQIWFSFAILFIILTALSGYIGFQSYKEKTNHNTAIIFTPTIDIKSAPDNKSNTIFILHQGTKVTLLENSAKWQKVRIANGSEGWLMVNNFEKI